MLITYHTNNTQLHNIGISSEIYRKKYKEIKTSRFLSLYCFAYTLSAAGSSAGGEAGGVTTFGFALVFHACMASETAMTP